MHFDIHKHKSDLIFLPLGGAGEIGMNFNLYQYQGKWLIVDCGSGFAEEYLPGVDIIIPDISYILNHKKDLLGIVLTHAHEDHIGALQYLWKDLNCPVYATPFTAEFLKLRFSENKFTMTNKIIELPVQGKVVLGPFKIEMMPLSHSTPEMQALVIRTDLGNIFHTGDWKFDDKPVLGPVNDEALLAKYGDEGILALIGDSTNVFNPGYSGSETDLQNSLIDLVAGCKKMVVVATFASNVGRVESLIKAAQKSGRKVALLGRSLKRILKAARSSGYLLDIPEIIDEREISKYERDKILIIATGCQGEPLAAVTKLAHNSHPIIKLQNGDTVIFSSKIIPGNDKKLFRVFNKLVKLGTEILTERDHFVHVSGHPAREELSKLYKLLRPEILIPVHGEHVHMHEHAKLGKNCGIQKTIEVENGVAVRIAPGIAEKVGRVEAGELAVYGHFLLKPDSSIMKMRRKLQHDGILFVVLVLARNYTLAADPLITAPGYLDDIEDLQLIAHMQSEIKILFTEQSRSLYGKNSKAISENTQKIVESRLRSILRIEVDRTPIIRVIVKTV